MFRAPKVPELRVRETEKSTLESETKILDHYSIQTYPQLVGNMASETTFDHWKVVFLMSKSEKK